MTARKRYPQTPDGRYLVVRGRLWRFANPNLSATERDRLIHELMQARRAIRNVDPDSKKSARAMVDVAKRSLGERGAVWWTDGSPDYNRKMAINTPYRAWYQNLVQRTRIDTTCSCP